MNWSNSLRRELSRRAERFAENGNIPYFTSSGGTVLFERFAEGRRHGNFSDAAFIEILRNPDWVARLEKVHTQRSKLPADRSQSAMELDSCNSSDALLMNIFCHPQSKKLAPLLGLSEEEWVPEFG